MWKPLLLILLMITIGIIGFHIIEGWPFLDCLYMSVITIFTVGFKEEFAVTKDSRLVDRTLRECDIRKTANITVVAVKKPGKGIIFNPSPDIQLETGDILLVLDDEKEVSQFESIYLEAQT